ncbi:putative integral membrane export protein [Streptomyces scabiei 87.22]|uniref:Putative integral membrane export protein n=2 Tax=Streptomyces scabiei TaxID=1930 RepID=C9Z6C3_STRSW|nr:MULTISPECIES: MMPL family transporter [Streptomyces]MBP5872650.1 MMPL family transporter [Streptomyces sp. LBUM 1485]MBP5911103.1 MMPL family transporter [Streptomyces sp. LBUM 1486]MDX2653346.1 MMPL family transporter [Streptomyces scabiei]MDX2724039.1 MMPL family transporter [Streptomyces scabiei]MDX2866277.1 MMPL family transporter [Streptomyces scabiei]
MSSLARWCHRHRLAVVLVWVGLLLVLGAGVGAAGSAFGNSPISQDTDSARATALLQKASDSAAGKSGRVVWQLNGGKVTEPAAERTMTSALKDIADAPGVAAVTSPYTSAGKGQISEDGRTAYATVAFDEDVPDARIDHVKDLATEAGTDSLHIALNGQAFTVNPEPNAVADAMGIILAFIVLLFVFRAVWVAALPIITAVVGVGTSAVTVILLSHVITLSDTTLTLGSLIGLGVGIDYALFIVNRHRGNLMSGMSVADSVAKSLNTSGRAVVFAGLTVVVALLGMLTLNVGIINGMAIGAAVTVVLTVLAALTLLPAMLGLIGPRVLSRRERGTAAGRTRTRSAGRAGVWGRWAERVQARPRALGLVALAVLTALAFPALSLRLGASDDGNLPTASTNRQAYDMIADGFGPGFNGPLVLAVQAPAPTDKAAAARLVTALGEADGVAGVAAAPMKDGQSVGVVSVVPTTSPQSAATSDLIHHLRDDVIPRAERGTSMTVYVGGVTASNDDFASVLMGKLPLFVLVIAALGFLLLAVAFRSLLVPAVGALLNILSIGVAFGAIVVVFQYGYGAGLLGLGSAGPIESFVPILVVGIMFGLSMDYQVFLVSRMREEWAHTGDSARAVRVGQAETGKVIAVAATIMVCVFGSFVFGGMRVISEFGVSLAVAVAADALLIRMIVVPALMHLCGKANWWLPRRLDRALPNISVEGPADEPAPPLHPVRERETAGQAN